MRIKGLTATTVIMCVMNLAGIVLVDWASPNALCQAAFYGFWIVAGYPILWFYWNQKNWARVLVMIGAVVSIVNLMFINDLGLPAQILILLEFPFGVFMLWWLNTRAVKAAFQTPSSNVATQPKN